MEISLNCPFCEYRGNTPDIHRHFYYNTNKKKGFCFRCGKKYVGFLNIYDLDKWKKKGSGKEIRLVNPVSLHESLILTPDSILSRLCSSYLKEHNLVPVEDYAYRYNLMTDEGIFLLFPQYHGKEMVYWQKRMILGRSKIFINKPGEKPIFFNKYEGRNRDKIVIVESITNCMRLDKYIKSAALYGKFLPEEKAYLFSSYKDILIWLDPGEMEKSIQIERNIKKTIPGAFVRIAGDHSGDICEIKEREVIEELGKFIGR